MPGTSIHKHSVSRNNLNPEEGSVTNSHFYLEPKLRETPFLAFRNKKLFSICPLASYKFIFPDTCPVSRTIFDVF